MKIDSTFTLENQDSIVLIENVPLEDVIINKRDRHHYTTLLDY